MSFQLFEEYYGYNNEISNNIPFFDETPEDFTMRVLNRENKKDRTMADKIIKHEYIDFDLKDQLNDLVNRYTGKRNFFKYIRIYNPSYIKILDTNIWSFNVELSYLLINLYFNGEIADFVENITDIKLDWMYPFLDEIYIDDELVSSEFLADSRQLGDFDSITEIEPKYYNSLNFPDIYTLPLENLKNNCFTRLYFDHITQRYRNLKIN